MNIIEEIRKFVEEESKKPGAKYGYDPYKFHLIPMCVHAKKLAREFGADVEIVELASWLHDIGSIIYGRENHHSTGAEIAERKLKKLNYPLDKIRKIKHCILSHRSSNGIKAKTLEAKIISDSDAISNFDNIAGIFKAAFVYEKQNEGEAKESTREKLQRKWNKLYFEESKNLIREKYEAVMLLLK